jgi:hypothetical protein
MQERSQGMIGPFAYEPIAKERIVERRGNVRGLFICFFELRSDIITAKMARPVPELSRLFRLDIRSNVEQELSFKGQKV